jgi:hypothetical protein
MTRLTVPFGFIIAALVFGLLFRLFPIVTGQPDLSEAFITEDGYLMLTVARNMAIGLGMSVSDGTIATNGIQPMATYFYTLPYLWTEGDKVTSLMGIHVIMAAVAFAAIWAVRDLAARLLRDQQVSTLLPWIVATLWFVGPVLLRHSMNGLETGLITLVTVVTLIQFARVIEKGADAQLIDRLGLGLMCGLVFLARIDAAILCVMIFAVWALDMLIRQRQSFGRMLVWLFPAGVLSLVVAAPWLLNNLLNFGSIMPISGPAQSLKASFGGHAELIPAKVFEFFFPMIPVPAFVERRSIFIAIGAVTSAFILVWFLVRVIRFGSAGTRAVVAAYVLHGLALLVYYGLFFGAPHFLSRYMAPIAPLMIIASVSVALDIGRWVLPRAGQALALVYGIGGIVVSLGFLIVLLLPGNPKQGHEQVVAWVSQNVEPQTWVAAVQTGTLGYWHDRTINLDGKVNPQALAARQEFGHVLDYVIASEIDYIVDWAGVGNWIKRPGQFSESFELVLQDADINLSVMRRIDPRANP